MAGFHGAFDADCWRLRHGEPENGLLSILRHISAGWSRRAARSTVRRMELDEYQREANRTDQRPGSDERALFFPVIGLSSEVGSLVRHVKKRLRDGDAHELFSDQMAEELGDVMWYVANLAEKLGLGLEEVAQRNLLKISGRWPRDGQTLPLPIGDENFPEHERLPRQTHVRFVESVEGDKTIVRLYGPDGTQLGNQLTDNAYEDIATTTSSTSATWRCWVGRRSHACSSASSATAIRRFARLRTPGGRL